MNTGPTAPDEARGVALDSLAGLALGDAFGEQIVSHPQAPQHRRLPPGRWRWTDDTALAIPIVRMLLQGAGIDQDRLASDFAATYAAEPWRGYGAGMHRLLPAVAEGASWREEARSLFGAQGSFGNGAAMRIAPLGAFFHRDLDAASDQARLVSELTHAHPEGIAGGIAVAVAAGLAAGSRGQPAPDPVAFVMTVRDFCPNGEVGDALELAAELDPEMPVEQAARTLGSGQQVTAMDTVPFVVWSAAHGFDNLTTALWDTARGYGDVDTTCAMVGGIVAARTGVDGVPAEWRERCEPLPEDLRSPAEA